MENRTPPPPPAYGQQYQPAPKKSNVGLIIGIVVAVVSLCCVLPAIVLVGGSFWAWNQVSPMAGCAMGLSEAQTAMKQYEKEHGKFPPAETWQDDIKETFRKVTQSENSKEARSIFESFPVDGEWTCSKKPPTGIAYNSELAGKKLADLKDPNMVMFFEVEKTGRNLHEVWHKRSDKSAPSIFGEKRGWIELRVNEDSGFDIDKAHKTGDDADKPTKDAKPAKNQRKNSDED